MYLFTTYVGMHFTVNKICLKIVTKPNSLVWVLSQKRHKRISKLWYDYWFCRFKCQHKRKTFFHQEEKPYSLFWQQTHKKQIYHSCFTTFYNHLFPFSITWWSNSTSMLVFRQILKAPCLAVPECENTDFNGNDCFCYETTH